MVKCCCVVALLTVVLVRETRVSAQGGPPALPATVTLDEVLKLLEERSLRTAAERASIPVVATSTSIPSKAPRPSCGPSMSISGRKKSPCAVKSFSLKCRAG